LCKQRAAATQDEALHAAAIYSQQYISDRFLPDKAIDLIDEAGSRVRLRHAQLPEEAREVEKELRAIQKEKDSSVRAQVRAVTCLLLVASCLIQKEKNLSVR
jgi:ATP-dependent Clp protease ATP-binding subunit ClpA